jgi:hypothetical protein
MGASFENDDFQIGSPAPGLGCGTHPCRFAADNNQSFPGHDFPPVLSQFKMHNKEYANCFSVYLFGS